MQGKTPFEAAFGKKPDLMEVWEWGEKVWVRIEGGDKLGGQVHEGQWMGISEDLKGIRVYWPATKQLPPSGISTMINQLHQSLVSKGRNGMVLLKQKLTSPYLKTNPLSQLRGLLLMPLTIQMIQNPSKIDLKLTKNHLMLKFAQNKY